MNLPVRFSILLFLLPLVSAAGESGAILPEKHFSMFEKYCLDCHDSATEKGEVNLEDLSFTLTDDIATAELWNKVLDAMNSGEMPPHDKTQVPDKEKTAFLRDLSEQMVLARSIFSDTGGEIALRRLNRREYANTLEELLGVRPDTSFLPDDQANAEFDTLGGSLYFSSDQLEQYLATARRTLELALLAKAPKESAITRVEPEEFYYPHFAKVAAARLDRAKRYYEWEAAGGTDEIAKEYGYLDGWQAGRQLSSFQRDYPALDKWLSAPENRKGTALMITIKDSFTQTKLPQIRAWQPGRYIIRVKAGAYLEDPARFRYLEFVRREGQNVTRLGWRKVSAPVGKPETIEFEIDHQPGVDAAYWVQKRTHMERGDKNLESEFLKEGRHTPWGVWIDWAEIEGPLPARKKSPVASLLAEKSGGQSESDHARDLLAKFATHAFRGETPNEEYLGKLMEHFETGREAGKKWKEALIDPLSIVLSSPSFLYLVEATEIGDGETGGLGDGETGGRLSGRELATRLSYFLWSAPPDEELLAFGQSGELSEPEVLRKQTERLLAEERAKRFVRHFTHQWLDMHRLRMFSFDARTFPDFDEGARDCAGEEIYETFATILAEGLPLRNLLKSDFVVINDLLADYYGIEGVKGSHFRKVTLPGDSPRGGLIGTAAIAAMGSDGQRSSPVERGVWVLRHLLNNPPPPAPPNVPQLSRFEDDVLSARELQKAHQEEAQCAQCHQKIDPIGYGLENFSAAGLWRDSETILGRKQKVLATFPVQPSGQFTDGTSFADYFELREVVADRIDDFAMGLTEALITYGLGRPFGFSDQELAFSIVQQAAGSEYAIAEIIYALVQSEAFGTY
ncbi:MAG: DUF1592 domain-containing protein [Verrucomicrobiales bacterium]|nr:DUF1592 domain-containing protein [Verrucomicrobiales bacterium]